jgi:hypothetical protein
MVEIAATLRRGFGVLRGGARFLDSLEKLYLYQNFVNSGSAAQTKPNG